VTKLLEDLISEYQSREKRTTSISTSSSIVLGLDNNGGKVDWSFDFLKYVQKLLLVIVLNLNWIYTWRSMYCLINQILVTLTFWDIGKTLESSCSNHFFYL